MATMAGLGCSGQTLDGEPQGRPTPPNVWPTAVSPMASATTASTSAFPTEPKVSAEAARALLAREGLASSSCASAPDQLRCWIQAAYREHPEASKLVLSIYDDTGSVVGVEPGRLMDGGWRGKIALVPEWPVGRHRRHLAWIQASLADFSWFFRSLSAHTEEAIRYRYAPLELAFFRSVGRTTPSAYASGWRVAYNVRGSLHRGPAAVRETMFHEVFHLNDAAEGAWSQRVLSSPFERIVARCSRAGRLSTPCLRPYAPGTTMVRGGTFYAFEPGNGVGEYAAELALRYYREHRSWLKRGRLARPPFKCGPPENAETWTALVGTFFASVDLVPACDSK